MLELIPVSILTGFLGSGKTTLLRRLLAHKAMQHTAVIINEFGEIGLDHLLVRSASEKIILLNSGCLCCTVRSSLIETLRDLFLKRADGEVPAFDRVVIETTGLADPVPVLQPLMSDALIAARFCVDGVITTVDAVNGVIQLEQHVECVKQAAVADRLLLTKLDIATPSHVTELKDTLRRLNPGAPIHTVSHGEIEISRLFDAGVYNASQKSADAQRWLMADAYRQKDLAGHDHRAGAHSDCDDDDHGLDANRHDQRIRAFCLNYEPPIAWPSLLAWLEALLRRHGANMLRIKGIINVAGADHPIVINGVHHVFHPPMPLEAWPSTDHRTRIVVIARDLNPDVADQLFRSIASSVS